MKLRAAKITLWKHRGRVAEAMVLLTFAWIALHALPFRFVAPLLGQVRPPEDGLGPTETPHERNTALAVRRALSAARRRLPWRNSCLVQTLAGRLMLGRRGVPSLARIGVASRPDLDPAHAWLIAAGVDVSGGSQAPSYAPISDFVAKAKPRPR